MRKLFTLLTLLVCLCTGAWASTVDDLTVISADYEYTPSVAFTDATLYDNNKLLSLGGSGYKNGLQIKASRQVAFKVSGACVAKFTFTEKSDNETPRKLQIGSSSAGTEYGNSGTSPLQCNITAAGVVYISASSDLYLTKIEITFPVSGNPPTINTQPVGAEYEVGDNATALSVSATAHAEGALSYQWYSNTTNSTEGADAINGATSSTYTPSTESAGTTYYYCVVTEAGNEDVAKTKIVAVTVSQNYTIRFAAGESGATISFPASFTYENGTVISLPTNHYFYKSGKKVSKWNDGSNDYAIGANYTVSSDVTFYPVFDNDNITLGESATTITWAFTTGAGAPTYVIQGDGASTTVIGATANGKDLTLGVSCSVNPDNANDYGKFDNTFNSTYIQVNKRTSFTLPAIKGMTVTYTSGAMLHTDASGFDFGTYDSDISAEMTNNNLVFTYNGTEESITFTDKDGTMWPTGITVSYPYTGAALPSGATSVEGVAKTISYSVSNTISSNTWSSDNYTFGGGDLKWSGQNFKVGYPKDLTISVPSGIKVTKFTMTAQSESNSGSSVTVANAVLEDNTSTGTFSYPNTSTTKTYIISNPAAGASITITNSTKNFLISSIVLYAETGITLTTTANMAGWRAFYDASTGYTVDANTKIYIVTAKDETKATLTEVTGRIPAQTPVLLKTSADNRTMTLTKATSGTDIDATGNKLTVTDGTAVSNVYRLGYGAEGVGFYQYSATSPASGIVYLSSASQTPAKALTLAFSDVTGISGVSAKKAVSTGKRYNLSGQLVGEDYKGIVIENGKKYIK